MTERQRLVRMKGPVVGPNFLFLFFFSFLFFAFSFLLFFFAKGQVSVVDEGEECG